MIQAPESGQPGRALVLGISGQDGSYLAEHLLELGYEVTGVVRRNSVPEHQESRLDTFADQLTTVYGDLTDPGGLYRTLRDVQPTEVYNLAAQSHVRISFDVPEYTAQANALGVVNILDAVRHETPQAKFYQASSSELFGTNVDSDGYQRETTAMHPASPYGCAKLYAYHLTRTYRDSYHLFAANGILFNHESPRRGSNFVTNKVVKAAVRIKLGLQSELVLGNMDSKRDWGHSWDYVRAMRLILQQEAADDYVIATGEARSVRDLCAYAFGVLGLDYEEWVRVDARLLRPKEVPFLRGDASKARTQLNWTPKYTFESMIDEMLDFWLSQEGRLLQY